MQTLDVYVQIAGSQKCGVVRNLEGDLAVSMFEVYPKGIIKAFWITLAGETLPILGKAPEGWSPSRPHYDSAKG
jgi:hypothetical protein